jgi:hypothetical protein
MTPIERKARELLAAEYERAGRKSAGEMVLSGNDTVPDEIAIRALVAALTPPAGVLPELPEVGPLDLSAPERVWLQVDTDGDNEDRSDPMPPEAWSHLSWYWEQIGGQEVEYVRADLARAYALEAIAASRVGWLPIESAPRRGSFLVFGGEWVGESKDRNERSQATITMVHRTGRGEFWVANAEEYWPWIEGPTHWQPLPAAPQVALNRGGEETVGGVCGLC